MTKILSEDAGQRSHSEFSFQLTRQEVWHRPLTYLKGDLSSRFMLRGVLWFFGKYILQVTGLENITPDKDPQIILLNHNQKMEAILVPSLLVFARYGKRVHFLSDWNFRLIPGLSYFLRKAETIILMNKSAKPKFLNVLKPLFAPKVSGYERAQEKLEQGGTVGIYPEGTINRDPKRLLRGYTGAARLSLVTGVSVVPVGIRFPGLAEGEPIREWIPMEMEIGAPIRPNQKIADPTLDQIKEWHAILMQAIGVLSGKEWDPSHRKKKT